MKKQPESCAGCNNVESWGCISRLLTNSSQQRWYLSKTKKK